MNEEIVNALLSLIWFEAVSVVAYQMGKIDATLERMDERDRERNKH